MLGVFFARAFLPGREANYELVISRLPQKLRGKGHGSLYLRFHQFPGHDLRRETRNAMMMITDLVPPSATLPVVTKVRYRRKI